MMDRPKCLNDFKLLRVVGKGSYMKIFLVSRNIDQKLFILKVLKKKRIHDQAKLQEIVKDKGIFKQLSHPFLIKMQQSFSDENKHYFVFEHCSELSLFQVLAHKQHLNEEYAKIYAAQILLALKQLHQHDIIYGDLQPFSVIFQKTGSIKLIDFGVSRTLHKAENRIKYFCQEPEYVAPEIITNKEIGKSLDWWCFGCLLYEMVKGRPPFINKDKDQIRLFQDILFALPDVSKLSPELSDLLLKLLQKDPNKRLGCNGNQEIQAHPWFKDINFSEIMKGEVTAPIIPSCQSADLDSSSKIIFL